MPISLQKMAANTASVTVQVGDDAANIVYYPSRVNEKALFMSFDQSSASAMAASFGEFNVELANLIQSWDIFEDDAQTQLFPIDAARFSELPLDFRLKIYKAIVSDVRPEGMASQTIPN
jgi:hypothetical protein